MNTTNSVVPFLFKGPEIDVEGLYRRYGPMVLRRCRAILVDEDAAQDAMQDVFVLLLRKKNNLVGAYPSSLLYRMATNRCLNMLRSARRRRDTPDEETLRRVQAPGNLEEEVEGRDLVARLFAGERESTRQMVAMHHRDGMTLRATAAVMGMSESGVRKRMRSLKTRGVALLSA